MEDTLDLNTYIKLRDKVYDDNYLQQLRDQIKKLLLAMADGKKISAELTNYPIFLFEKFVTGILFKAKTYDKFSSAALQNSIQVILSIDCPYKLLNKTGCKKLDSRLNTNVAKLSEKALVSLRILRLIFEVCKPLINIIVNYPDILTKDKIPEKITVNARVSEYDDQVQLSWSDNVNGSDTPVLHTLFKELAAIEI